VSIRRCAAVGEEEMRRIRLVLAQCAVVLLVLSSPAYANSSVVVDATGDVAAGSPAYVDIVQAKVTHQVGRDTIYFSMELAGGIPATPPDSFLAYNWFVDVNGDNLEDYVVVVRWCTEQTSPRCGAPGPLPRWEAFVNDFAHPVTFFSSFKVDGAVVKAFVDPAALGGATAFDWRTVSRTAPAGGGKPPVDRAPNSGFAPFGR
jgi:hypothetical protein